MSIAELATVVNSNFTKPLNEQARELAYAGSYLFVSSKTFTPDKTGWYKVIVVGKGGESKSSYNNIESATGGSGGVAIKTMRLFSSNNYSVAVTDSESSFNSSIKAKAGTDGSLSSPSPGGIGGEASGGDFNYNGNDGIYDTSRSMDAIDVGVFIPTLMERDIFTAVDYNNKIVTVKTGYGILGYGSCSGATNGEVGSSKGGCVLIIPLELEE